MAQTGYTPISIYYSSTASATPTAGNLVAGELAINTADGKLFYKDSAGVVQVIGTKGGVGSSSTTQVLYNSSGLVVGSANLTFNGTDLTLGGGLNVTSAVKFINTTTAPAQASIYAPAANTLAFSPNGSEAMRIDSASKVGIGTTAITSPLTVQYNSTSPSLTPSQAGINFIGSSSVRTLFGTDPASPYASWIQTSNNVGSSFPLSLNPLGGNVGIGISNIAYPFHVYAAAGQLASFQNNLGNAYIGITDNNGAQNATFGSISGGNAYVYSGGYSSFYTGGGNENMRINGNGNISLANAIKTATGVGITFPATQSASTDANCLDDYEEGTFTPTFSSGLTSVSYSSQNGYYTKIGNVVYFTVHLQTSTATKNASIVNITGLPFGSNSASQAGAWFDYTSGSLINSTTTNLPTIYLGSSSTVLQFYNTSGGSFVGNDVSSSAVDLYFTGYYFTA